MGLSRRTLNSFLATDSLGDLNEQMAFCAVKWIARAWLEAEDSATLAPGRAVVGAGRAMVMARRMAHMATHHVRLAPWRTHAQQARLAQTDPAHRAPRAHISNTPGAPVAHSAQPIQTVLHRHKASRHVLEWPATLGQATPWWRVWQARTRLPRCHRRPAVFATVASTRLLRRRCPTRVTPVRPTRGALTRQTP